MSKSVDGDANNTNEAAISQYELGSQNQEKGNYEAALIAFNKAIELNPNYIQAYERVSEVLLASNEFARAIIAADKAIQLDPNFLDPYIIKGYALLASGKIYEAKQCCNTLATHITDNNVQAYTALLHQVSTATTSTLFDTNNASSPSSNNSSSSSSNSAGSSSAVFNNAEPINESSNDVTTLGDL